MSWWLGLNVAGAVSAGKVPLRNVMDSFVLPVGLLRLEPFLVLLISVTPGMALLEKIS